MAKASDFVKASAAYLHQPITWPGGPVNSEKSISTTKWKSVELYYNPSLGLVIQAKDKQCIVPPANIANVIPNVNVNVNV